jgi:hypothetical protein
VSERVVGITISPGRGDGEWLAPVERLSVTMDCEIGLEEEFTHIRRAVLFGSIREVLNCQVIAIEENGSF